jgi:hypothetical protein
MAVSDLSPRFEIGPSISRTMLVPIPCRSASSPRLTATKRNPLQHDRQLLGQCPRRELLPLDQNGVALPLHLRLTSSGPQLRLRLHRRASTIAAACTPRSAIALQMNMKLSSMSLNPVSAFSGEDQTAPNLRERWHLRKPAPSAARQSGARKSPFRRYNPTPRQLLLSHLGFSTPFEIGSWSSQELRRSVRKNAKPRNCNGVRRSADFGMDGVVLERGRGGQRLVCGRDIRVHADRQWGS